jgi:hypothetical protein
MQKRERETATQVPEAVQDTPVHFENEDQIQRRADIQQD